MSAQLSRREKTLSIIVGAAAFLFVTFFVADYFAKNKARLTADLASKTRELKTMQTLSTEKALWEQRDAWLLEKQPKLANQDSAGVELLDRIKELAKKHVVLIDKSGFSQPGVVRKPEYTEIGIDIETKSSWRALVSFLGELQSPEQFIVLKTNPDLKIDATDATQMRGKFKIARWYAPK